MTVHTVDSRCVRFTTARTSDPAAQPVRADAIRQGSGPNGGASRCSRLHRQHRGDRSRAAAAPALPDQHIFENFAGRPLEPAERPRVGTIYKMTPAQIELAMTLAQNDRVVAFLYLSRIAPDDPIEARNDLAKHFAGS
jgi:hypothetical protein